MLLRSPEAIFRPQSVAIVGASETAANGWSKTLFDNLAVSEFSGRVYLVNPRRDTVWGQPCYPDFAHLPERIDVALVVVSANLVPGVLEEGAAHGLRSAVLYASGLREADGGNAHARVAALCRDGGMRINGPNGMGTIAFRERAVFYSQARVRGLPVGETGVVFSSGGSLQHWLRQAAIRGLGFSYAVSSGDEIDLDIADYLDFLVDDPHTRVICALMEGVRRPEAFVEIARKALERRKPIVVVKIGRSRRAQHAAASHTGALAVDDEIFNVVCERYGIIRVPTLDDLIDTALVLRDGHVPAGPRVGMICHSGGIKGLFLDEAEQEGVRLATFSDTTLHELEKLEPGAAYENPFDAGATLAENSQRFQAVCESILADPGIDLFAVQGRLPTDTPGQHPASLFARIAATSTKPMIAFERMSYNLTTTSRDFQREATIPFVQGVAQTVRAIAALVRYGARSERGVPPLADPRPERATHVPFDAIDEALAAGGATRPREHLVRDPSEAVEAAERIGFPVALKAVGAALLHKTEHDAVRLGLRDSGSVATAAMELQNRLAPDGLLVQEMVPPGLEMLVGAREDPQFGPLLIVGAGGVDAELVRDTAIGLLPLDRADVETMLETLRTAPGLGPYRGRPARDVEALVTAVLAVGNTFLAHRASIADLEINPLIVGAIGAGVRAVDVRVIARS